MSAPAPLWPVIVRLGEVIRFTEAAPMHRRLVADEAVRKAVAKAFNLVSLDRLEAELDVSGWFDGVRIDGRWKADIVQTCGVSLEPFATALAGEFTVHAVPEGSRHATAGRRRDRDRPRRRGAAGRARRRTRSTWAAMSSNTLALEIDPFPRKPGAVFEPPEPWTRDLRPSPPCSS